MAARTVKTAAGVSAKTAAAAAGTNTQDRLGRRVATKGEPQFANYAGKNVPPVIQEFAEWLTAETGYEVDLRSVYLGSSLRGQFQKSEGNQARIEARAQEIVAEREARAQAKIDRAAAKETRAAERAAAKAEREAAAAAKAAEPKAAPAAKTTKAATAKAPAKAATKTAAKAPAKTTPTRRRPARGAATQEANGDF